MSRCEKPPVSPLPAPAIDPCVADPSRLPQICRSLAHNTYLCRYEPADLEQVRQVPYVIYANVLHKDLKINFDLKQKMRNGADTDGADGSRAANPESPTHDVNVVLHPRPDRDAAQLREHMIQVMGVPQDQIRLNGDDLRATLRPADIEQLAHLDEIMAIEEVPEYEGFNNLAQVILNNTSSMPSVSDGSSSSSSSSSSSTVYN